MEHGKYIFIPDNATNKQVIMALFPNQNDIDGYFSFSEEWANSPYTVEENKNSENNDIHIALV